NPQNMLVGQALDLSFAGYLLSATPVCIAGLAATWALIAWQTEGSWEAGGDIPAEVTIRTPAFNRWQTTNGLFVVNAALQRTDLPREVVDAMERGGVHVAHPAWLFALTVGLSNAVSNVPAVMLLLPFSSHELSGVILALASTFAGNLLIVGSIANIIVVDAAARGGVTIDWRRHARTGVPVTIVTLAIAGCALLLQAKLR